MKPNQMNMMRQVQKMQADLAKAQEELAESTVEASVGGGAVKVVMRGDLTVESVTIEPSAVDPEDVGMLQDLIAAAFNEAVRQAQELQSQKMQAVTGPLGGLGIPGLM
jgi:DNA-binding YbaB/EbfC family protein